MAKEAENLENLPPVASEYIEAIIRKMRYRRKVRQEVKAELASHFADALADCRTDEERQGKTQELINEFGDAKLLATLIRRGKKRCRPLWRTMVARSFGAVGLAILLLIVYVVWFFSGKPSVTIDYVAEMNRAARPVADDNLNAGPFYHKAAESFQDSYDSFVKEHPDLLAMSYNKATSEQKEALSKWIAANTEIFDLVYAGAAKPYYWPKYEGQAALSVLLPNLRELRELSRTLCWRAWLRAEQGLYKDAFEDIKTCYRLGQHLKGDKVLIEQLVGIAIEALTCRTLRQILSKHEFDRQTLAVLQDDWEELILQEDFAVSIRVEKLFIFDEIQRCFTEDRIGSGHLYLKGISELGVWEDMDEFHFIKFLHILHLYLKTTSELEQWEDMHEFLFINYLHILLRHPNKQETRETLNRLWDYFEEVAKKNPGQRRAEQIDVDEDIEQFSKGNIFLSILVPALNRISISAHRNKAEAESVLTLIAVLRHKEKVGKFPESLDELVKAGLLKTLPIDPFSDEPLIYRRTDDGFTLYSVGENFTDDGGVVIKDSRGRAGIWADEGDAVFWPIN